MGIGVRWAASGKCIESLLPALNPKLNLTIDRALVQPLQPHVFTVKYHQVIAH